MLSKLFASIASGLRRLLGPKRDDPKRAAPPAASTPPSPGPRRDDPK